MSIVIDANIVVALVLPLPYSDRATQKVASWQQSGTDLYAPLLMEYEVTTILRRAVVSSLSTGAEVIEILRYISDLNIQPVLPDIEVHLNFMDWAERVGQAKTYDAYYLSAAEQLRAELWTADRRLANGARQAGVGWAHWIGEE